MNWSSIQMLKHVQSYNGVLFRLYNENWSILSSIQMSFEDWTIIMNLNTESKNFINQNTGRIQIRTVIIFLLGAFHVKSKPGIGYHHTSLDETKFRRSGVTTQ